MSTVKEPGPLKLGDGNRLESWKKFKREFENFLTATEKDGKSDKIKIAILQLYLGDEGLKLFDSFQLNEEDANNYELVIKNFENYCNPRKNIVMERLKFRNTIQKPGQSFDDFFTDLMRKISSCEYENEDPTEIKDHLLRDQLIIGLSDKNIQERLLRDADIDLERVVKLVRAWENPQSHLKELNPLLKEVDATFKTQRTSSVVRPEGRNNYGNNKTGGQRANRSWNFQPRNDNAFDDNWKPVTNTNRSRFNYKYDAQKIVNNSAYSPNQESPSIPRPQGSQCWRAGAGQKKGATTPAHSFRTSVLFSSKTPGNKSTPPSPLERRRQNQSFHEYDTSEISRNSLAQRQVSFTNPSHTDSVPVPSKSPLSEEQIGQYIIDFEERFKTAEDKQLSVRLLIECLLDRPGHIANFGKLVTALLQEKILSVPIVVMAASSVLKNADDLQMDYPKFWECMADVFGFIEWPLFNCNDCKLFNDLATALQGLPNKEKCCSVLEQMIKRIVRHNQDRIFEYLSWMIGTDTDEFDNVFKWIDEYVENPYNNPELVSALTETMCKTALRKTLKSKDIKEKYGQYLRKYLHNSEVLEITCLHTIVDFSRRGKHPQGFLLRVFEGLYDSRAVSSDSFMQLKKSQSEEIRAIMINVESFYDYYLAE